MRGGAFEDHHNVDPGDLRAFIAERNRPVAQRHASFFDGLPSPVAVSDLLVAAGATADADLIRLCHEYLPLYFGRRHGDPSRPWNMFNIAVRNPDGSRALQYEGNWRDIFQNWEALGQSYPDFFPNMIAKFLNASTIDGFNPYRITRAGIDWEIEDPDDPWSYIGYWGDHQIIYLLKLLESARRFRPGTLVSQMDAAVFSYANVPYRLAAYDAIVADPHDTIRFDHEPRANGAGPSGARG